MKLNKLKSRKSHFVLRASRYFPIHKSFACSQFVKQDFDKLHRVCYFREIIILFIKFSHRLILEKVLNRALYNPITNFDFIAP